MKQKIIKQVNYWLGVTVIGLVLGLSLQFARAWTEPAVAPPGGNVGAPINTGPAYQSKAAGLEINGNLDLQTAWTAISFDNDSDPTTGIQQFFGNGASAIYFDSNHDTATQMIFRDKQNDIYGRVYGSGDGNNFGLLDGDGNWSYLAVRDNYTQFRINNDPKMTIRNNGNVGIGTTSPSSPLHIVGDFRVHPVAGNSADRLSLEIDAGGTNNSYWFANRWGHNFHWERNSAGGRVRLMRLGSGGTLDIYNPTAAMNDIRVRLHPTGSSYFTGGNVGIGDTSPDSKLDIENGDVRISSAGTGLIFPDGTKQTTAAAGTDLHGWSFQNDKLLDDGENVIQTSDEWLRLNQDGNFANGIYTPRLIRADGGFQVDSKWAISNNNNWHRAQYVDNTRYGYFEVRRADGQRGAYFGWGSPGNYVQLNLENGNDLAITNGNVGIGTTTPGEKLDVNGTVRATAFIYSSDERLKKDVENVPDALERILNLRGVSFKWKENNEQSLGLIAQEAEKVFPELVVTSQIDGMKAVKYGNLVAPLIEAVKEQQEQIDLLKKEVEQLKLSK